MVSFKLQTLCLGSQLQSSVILLLARIFLGRPCTCVVRRSAKCLNWMYTEFRAPPFWLCSFQDSCFPVALVTLHPVHGFFRPERLKLFYYISILHVVDWGLSSGQKLQQMGNSFSSIVLSKCCWFLSRINLFLVIFQCFQVVIYLYCI